jgi:uncharacterized protein with HEPN domain
MPKTRNINLFFTDILEAIESIMEYTQNMSYYQFINDKKTKDAVVRNLEIIGEAVKNIPDDIKGKYSDVSWRGMSGMRDKLIHEYFGVSNQIVWETIQSDLPVFDSQIKKIMEE